MLIKLFSFSLIPLILILLFLSIVFIQSSLDKVINWKSNLDFTISTLSSKFPKYQNYTKIKSNPELLKILGSNASEAAKNYNRNNLARKMLFIFTNYITIMY